MSNFLYDDDDELIKRLSPEDIAELDALLKAQEEADRHDWDANCLPYQRLPHNVSDCPWVSRDYGAGKAGNDSINAVAWVCGIGAGKTTTLRRNLQHLVETGQYRRIGILSPSEKLYREEIALPLEAESPDWCKAKYRSNESKIVWPNGAQAILLSSQRPELIRGFNLDLLACDDVVAWQYESCYNLGRGRLRVGDKPLTIIATTPKPTPLIWQILNDPRCAVITASTYDNTTLSPEAIEATVGPWRGHPDYEQEILGRIHQRIAGALWTPETINGCRVVALPEGVEFVRVVVGVDPGGFGDDGDEAGIVVVGKGSDGLYYVLADYSFKGSPNAVAEAIVKAYRDWFADAIIYERNQGGNWIEALINTVDATTNLKGVHAKQGKRLRAEPISAMYNRDEVKHVGTFDALEKQMRSWIPGKGDSPDRVDGLVYAVTELSGKGREVRFY